MKTKNSRCLFVFTLIAVLATISVIFSGCNNKNTQSIDKDSAMENSGSDTVSLNLSDFQKNGEYTYASVEWGMTADEVENALGFSISVNEYREEDNQGDPVFYGSSKVFTLDELNAGIQMEFYKDQIRVIKFSFEPSEDIEEWFDKQVNTLKDLYGEETEKMENSANNLNSVGYRWATDNTQLQIVKLTGDSIQSTVSISAFDTDISKR